MMNKLEFTDTYGITDVSAADPSARPARAKDFAEAISEFVSERFRAIAEVSVSVESEGCVLVCADYLALFLRQLFTAVFAREYLKIDISEQSGRLTVSITAKAPLPLTKKETDLLIKSARSAAMTVDSVENGFFLSIALLDEREFSVYARGTALTKSRLYKKLIEIFFQKR